LSAPSTGQTTRPLVLIHGLATTRDIWRRVVPLIERETITLDVPGFGTAPPVGDGFELDEVADAIAADLPERFDLVGHSMGGAIAMTIADRHPERVERLVLAAPAGLRPLPPRAMRAFGQFAVRGVALRRAGAPLADTRWGRRILMTPGTADPAALPPSEVRALLDASRGATRIAEALATVTTTDLRPLLAELPVPVGTVWGSRDRIVPSGGAVTVLELRPGSPAATVHGAGHIPMIEQPPAFTRALEQVLSALSRPVDNSAASRN
jgi:pimeloyl-ACP methyl ester carboxylesterase